MTLQVVTKYGQKDISPSALGWGVKTVIATVFLVCKLYSKHKVRADAVLPADVVSALELLCGALDILDAYNVPGPT